MCINFVNMVLLADLSSIKQEGRISVMEVVFPGRISVYSFLLKKKTYCSFILLKGGVSMQNGFQFSFENYNLLALSILIVTLMIALAICFRVSQKHNLCLGKDN